MAETNDGVRCESVIEVCERHGRTVRERRCDAVALWTLCCYCYLLCCYQLLQPCSYAKWRVKQQNKQSM